MRSDPWDEIAVRYNEIFGNEGDYSHKHIIYPAITDELGNVEGKMVIDLGCGTGTFTNNPFLKNAEKVLGVDSSKKMLEIARTNAPIHVSFVRANIEKSLPFPDQSFDKVISIMVLHTVEYLNDAISELSRIMKNSGESLIVVPHPSFVNNFRSIDNLDTSKYLTSQHAIFCWKQITDFCDSPTPFITRSFTEYSEAFSIHNLTIAKIIEPSIRDSGLDELDDIRTREVFRRLQEQPNFVIFKLKKAYVET